MHIHAKIKEKIRERLCCPSHLAYMLSKGLRVRHIPYDGGATSAKLLLTRRGTHIEIIRKRCGGYYHLYYTLFSADCQGIRNHNRRIRTGDRFIRIESAGSVPVHNSIRRQFFNMLLCIMPVYVREFLCIFHL